MHSLALIGQPARPSSCAPRLSPPPWFPIQQQLRISGSVQRPLNRAPENIFYSSRQHHAPSSGSATNPVHVSNHTPLVDGDHDRQRCVFGRIRRSVAMSNSSPPKNPRPACSVSQCRRARTFRTHQEQKSRCFSRRVRKKSMRRNHFQRIVQPASRDCASRLGEGSAPGVVAR